MERGSPPRPELWFRVGVIGNRWDKLGLAGPARTRGPEDGGPEGLERTRALETALERVTRDLLTQVAARLGAVAGDEAAGYQPGRGPTLAVVSGLAEGADRVAARAGLSAGYQLWAVFPFDPERYADDFDERWSGPSWSRPGARAEFRDLCQQASATLTMDGVPGRYDAYQALGRAVLDHSDLLVAVWDGDRSRGPGGTANLLLDARRQEVPIVRIDPAQPEQPWLEDLRQDDEGRADGLSRLWRRLDDLVRPPEQAGLVDPAAWNGRMAFFAETAASGRLGVAYRAMREFLLGLHAPIAAVLAPTATVWCRLLPKLGRRRRPLDYAAAGVTAWTERYGPTLGRIPGLDTRVIGRLGPIHGWLDQLATHYADLHRSTFTIIFSLAWIASVAAVLALIAHLRHWPTATAFAMIELGVLGLIFALTIWGNRSRHHRKWVDYRHLAEQIRHLAFLWPLGGAAGFARMPLRPSVDDPRVAWTGWYYRAVVRQLGFAVDRVDAAHLEACRATLRDREIPDQRRYHDDGAAAFRHLHHVVHLRTEWLFFAALVVSVAHLLGGAELVAGWFGAEATRADRAELLGAWLTVVSVFLPARAAALHGWAGHADFHAAALRSAAIEMHLEEQERVLDTLGTVTSGTLLDAGLAAARAMEGELGAWRATSLSRPLVRP